MTPTKAELAEFYVLTAHVPELRPRLLCGLGWRPATKPLLLKGPVATRTASPSSAPPPPDFNAAVRAAATGSAPEPPPAHRAAFVTRVAHDRSVPPPPDFNAAVRASVAARAAVARPLGAAERPAPATTRFSAADRTAPPPPDFNAAVRAAAHQKATR